MSDDLVKRLRSKTPNMTLGHNTMEEAAERIEELEAKLAEYRMGMSALDIQWVAELQRANVAEAKLSEAQFERDNNRGKHEIKKRELSVAADRIKELEAKLKSETERLGREVNLARYGQPDFAWSIHVQAMAELEAKLAKALRVFEEMRNDKVGFRNVSHFRRRAAVVIAELTGGKDDRQR